MLLSISPPIKGQSHPIGANSKVQVFPNLVILWEYDFQGKSYSINCFKVFFYLIVFCIALKCFWLKLRQKRAIRVKRESLDMYRQKESQLLYHYCLGRREPIVMSLKPRQKRVTNYVIIPYARENHQLCPYSLDKGEPLIMSLLPRQKSYVTSALEVQSKILDLGHLDDLVTLLVGKIPIRYIWFISLFQDFLF